jgi:PTH2 family peptidyl-tRNA hydrolase
MSTPKQIIVMRKDLNMRKGKMVAQGSHASLAALLNLGIVTRKYNEDAALWVDGSMVIPFTDDALREWVTGQFTKICVSVNSEQELISVINKAKAAGLITSLITDAGHTEFKGVPTITCGAVGPAYPEQLEGITSQLPLL